MGCLIPTYCETIGDCIENGMDVRRYCEVCMRKTPTDLLELAHEHGVDYWLWDRRTPCDYCGRMLAFLFSSSPSTPARPMISTYRHDVARSARIRAAD